MLISSGDRIIVQNMIHVDIADTISFQTFESKAFCFTAFAVPTET